MSDKGTMAFSVDVARRYGLDEAVFLNHVVFWLEKNAVDGRNIMDGRVWTFNTIADYTKLMPFFTRHQVNRVINSLKSKGVILTQNPEGYHRRTWITVADSAMLSEGALQAISHFRKNGNGTPQKRKTISAKTEMDNTVGAVENTVENQKACAHAKESQTLPPGWKEKSDTDKERDLAEIRRIRKSNWPGRTRNVGDAD